MPRSQLSDAERRAYRDGCALGWFERPYDALSYGERAAVNGRLHRLGVIVRTPRLTFAGAAGGVTGPRTWYRVREGVLEQLHTVDAAIPDQHDRGWHVSPLTPGVMVNIENLYKDPYVAEPPA